MNKILVVEDETLTQDMLRRFFEIVGYEVVRAVTGAEATRRAIDDQPSIIILDINLPDIDGYEVARQLRSSEKKHALTYVPVIAVTANALKGDAEKALAAGCDVYMSKPINIRELWARVEAFVPSPQAKE